MEGNGLITTAPTQRSSTARQLRVSEGNAFYHVKLNAIAILAITLNQIAYMCLILPLPGVCHAATGRCYWSTGEESSWDAARMLCQSQGGDLAVMETEGLWNFVLSKSSNLG